MSKTIVVTDRQVAAAQRLARIMGGLDKVDPLIRKIAEAQPVVRDDLPRPAD